MRQKAIVSGALLLFGAISLACVGANLGAAQLPTPYPTNTPMPTFTPTALASIAMSVPLSPTVTPTLPAPTPTDTLIPPTVTPMPPTATPIPPTLTPMPQLPTPTPMPTETPTPAATPDATASFIEYIIAGTSRSMNCQNVTIFGSVLNANNFGVAGATIEAVGIHDTVGQHVAQTGDDGRYEIYLGSLEEVPSGQWYVAIVRDNMEVSERFHWASTPICSSDDLGHSQHLQIDWKLIE